MRLMTQWLAVTALALTLGGISAAACDDPNNDVGARCTQAIDCTPPLVCSNRDATDVALGICVYPEALPDAATDAATDAAADAAADADLSSDASGV